jgi:hypothetical protein
MSNKQYPKFEAKPFGEAMDEIGPVLNKRINDPENTDKFSADALFGSGPYGQIFSSLLELVNPDVCLTKPQQERLVEDMYSYVTKPDQTKLLAMVAAINSYRTECSRCLAKNCGRRDPHDVE